MVHDGRYVLYQLALLTLALLAWYYLSLVFARITTIEARSGGLPGLRTGLVLSALMMVYYIAEPLTTRGFYPQQVVEDWHKLPASIAFGLILLCGSFWSDWKAKRTLSAVAPPDLK